jgi:hypothetical protein
MAFLDFCEQNKFFPNFFKNIFLGWFLVTFLLVYIRNMRRRRLRLLKLFSAYIDNLLLYLYKWKNIDM